MAKRPKTPSKDQVVDETPAAEVVQELEETRVIDATEAQAAEPVLAETPQQEEPPSDEPAKTEREAPPVRRSGLGVASGIVLGGVLAAVVGFGAARYVVPEGWPFPGVAPEVDPLAVALEAQAGAIEALEARLVGQEEALAALEADGRIETLQQDLTARLSEVAAQIDGLSERMNEAEGRITSVERLAPEGSEAAAKAAEAYAEELARLREMFAGELARIEAEQADAAALAREVAAAAAAAEGRLALAGVLAALDTGAPFADALAELGEVAVPDALRAVATAGAPTLAGLQAAFPEAAREAIDAATRAAVADGSLSRWEAFFKTQLGSRSLSPREGDDADAVLSRAEAALKSGDVASALDEVARLPEAARPALAPWVELAQTRAQAVAAADSLAQALNAK